MSIICIYHSADTDGRVSAGVVKQKFNNDEIDFVPANYGLNMKLNLTKDTTVIIVDFSLELDLMKDIQSKVKKFIWIDHHPVINQYKEQGFNPDGLRDTEHSAAYYCWKYFFPEQDVPDYIKYTSDYDTWTHKLKESMAFNAAMYNEPIFNIHNYDWTRLSNPDYMTFLLNNGNKILEFDKLKCDAVRPHIFQTNFVGYKTVAINMRNTNSTVFANCGMDYDIMMTFGKYGNLDDPRVTIYAKNDSVNVGKIAEGFGGGGHAGAAGFTVNWDMLPLCEKAAIDINYYLKPIDDIVTTDEYIRNYYIKECNRIYKSLGTSKILLNHKVIAINHPLWSVLDKRPFEDIIAWSFISGQYLYRAHLVDNSFKETLIKEFDGKVMPDESIWFVNDRLLFQ